MLKILRRVSFLHFSKLLVLGLKNPVFIVPAMCATRKTVAKSYQLYGKKHHVNGTANAFRHALWNYTIAKACSKWSKNKERVLRWTEEITDWHENAFPNKKLAMLMDMHNNKVGRSLYEKHPDMELEAIVTKLKEMTEKSVLIHGESDLACHEDNLVHIIP
ncbi:hypothetical protein [Allomuricauda sp. d1]|uniref:DUF6973 domain-containing protein n=1 Tax=Allomuricauda sp. d1 TaxID=3136725 RepID=UPI0031D40EAD